MNRLAVTLALLAPALGIHAQTTRSLVLSPYATDIAQGSSGGPGATYGSGFSGGRGLAGIVMPDPSGGISKFSFGFTIPEDYTPGTPLDLKVVWRSDAISCVIDLRNNFLQWAQAGALNRSGTLVKSVTMLAPNDNRQSNETLFLLNFVPMPAFAPGDGITGGLFRNSTFDSCADDFYVQGLSIVYEPLSETIFGDGFEDGP